MSRFSVIRAAAVTFVALAGLCGGGCNALYFYQTDRLSLTVEGKADATEPASFNLGFKQRVVAVMPARKVGDPNQTQTILASTETKGGKAAASQSANVVGDIVQRNVPRGDALSLISFFDMEKRTPEKPFKQPLEIRTAFITGDAAAQLDAAETSAAAKAVTEVAPVATIQDNADVAINNATEAGKLDKLRQLVRDHADVNAKVTINNQEFTVAQIGGSYTGFGSTYDQDLHNAIKDRLEKQP